MKDIAIVSSLRTAVGKANKGSLINVRPDDLGAHVIKSILENTNITANSIEDVVMGCAMPEAEQGMNVARIISLRAGLPDSVSAMTINRFCSSGLQAFANVANSINAGEIDVGIAGGVESMSMVPMGGQRPSCNYSLMEDYPQAYTPMGITAENVAKKFKVNRESQDQFAFESHKKAVNAIKNNLFKEEITPINIKINNKNYLFDTDEGPREDTSLEALAKLRPVFAVSGTVTAGNSSQVSDGAAAALLMTKESADSQNLPILGFFRNFVTAGVDPDIMGVGPVYAIKKLLDKTGLSLNDIGVFEINEAFAAQALYCVRELKLDPNKVNPNGGAIALGHPLGCTGARQVATILREMKRKKSKYGICSMCIGGGMGAAALIELV